MQVLKLGKLYKSEHFQHFFSDCCDTILLVVGVLLNETNNIYKKDF